MLLVGAALPIRADGDVPAALLVKIVFAAVAYDRSADKRFGDALEVAVIGSARGGLEEALGGFSDKKVKTREIRLVASAIDTLTKDKVDVVFFADKLGSLARNVASACKTAQITCVATDEADVKAGLPVGVELVAGKPRLLINLEAAKDCGADFPAQILKMSRDPSR